MRRLLTTCLLLLALAGIASGNLLRPCDCGNGEEADAHALCQSRATTDSSPTSCCGCGGGRLGEGAGGSDSPDDEEGCTLCCKPRPPLTEAAGSLKLADVQAVVVAVLDDLGSSVAAPGRTTAWTLIPERRTGDHWLLSPEGLAVFLI